jgi:hypothetical protein
MARTWSLEAGMMSKSSPLRHALAFLLRQSPTLQLSSALSISTGGQAAKAKVSVRRSKRARGISMTSSDDDEVEKTVTRDSRGASQLGRGRKPVSAVCYCPVTCLLSVALKPRCLCAFDQIRVLRPASKLLTHEPLRGREPGCGAVVSDDGWHTGPRRGS